MAIIFFALLWIIVKNITGADNMAQKKNHTLMGIREYARHRGVTAPAVSDAIKRGKISQAIVMVKGNKKIAAEMADKLWLQNTAPNNKNAKTLFNNADPNDAAQKIGDGIYTKARAAKESYSAKLAQLNYEKKSGKLCRVDDVVKAAAESGRITRDSILNLADKLAPILASETDIHTIREIMTAELEAALTNLATISLDDLITEDRA
tara:strand:+ start:124 stop:744 length:621 start_codon:yes stop_codon:yes gene_type:complete